MAEYTIIVQDFKNIERNIINDLRILKDTMNIAPTIKVEQNLQKSLNTFSTKVDKILEDYKNPKIKNELPEKEYNRRVNELQGHKQTYVKLNNEYDTLVNAKYGYVRIYRIIV
jgi:hypothetical protein